MLQHFPSGKTNLETLLYIAHQFHPNNGIKSVILEIFAELNPIRRKFKLPRYKLHQITLNITRIHCSQRRGFVRFPRPGGLVGNRADIFYSRSGNPVTFSGKRIGRQRQFMDFFPFMQLLPGNLPALGPIKRDFFQIPLSQKYFHHSLLSLPGKQVFDHCVFSIEIPAKHRNERFGFLTEIGFDPPRQLLHTGNNHG